MTDSPAGFLDSGDCLLREGRRLGPRKSVLTAGAQAVRLKTRKANVETQQTDAQTPETTIGVTRQEAEALSIGSFRVTL